MIKEMRLDFITSIAEIMEWFTVQGRNTGGKSLKYNNDSFGRHGLCVWYSCYR